ncbi:MAG TPA: hypothetical protein VN495_03085 [Candidatus Paceibacterota bacterium]|nr:hypothetical protein [Candidatus Paceibacterota bacterium]
MGLLKTGFFAVLITIVTIIGLNQFGYDVAVVSRHEYAHDRVFPSCSQIDVSVIMGGRYTIVTGDFEDRMGTPWSHHTGGFVAMARQPYGQNDPIVEAFRWGERIPIPVDAAAAVGNDNFYAAAECARRAHRDGLINTDTAAAVTNNGRR